MSGQPFGEPSLFPSSRSFFSSSTFYHFFIPIASDWFVVRLAQLFILLLRLRLRGTLILFSRAMFCSACISVLYMLCCWGPKSARFSVAPLCSWLLGCPKWPCCKAAGTCGGRSRQALNKNFSQRSRKRSRHACHSCLAIPPELLNSVWVIVGLESTHMSLNLVHYILSGSLHPCLYPAEAVQVFEQLFRQQLLPYIMLPAR